MDNKGKTKKKKSTKKIIVMLIIIVLILFIGVPVFVNVAYLQGGGITTIWDGPQFLAFYGAVLSAIGAIFLGAVSIWQNKKLREQNEIISHNNKLSQIRLEEISKRANELNTINKIIDYESNRLESLIIALQELEEVCNPAYIIDIYKEKMTELEIIKYGLDTVKAYGKFERYYVADFFVLDEVKKDLADSAKVLIDLHTTLLAQARNGEIRENMHNYIEALKIFNNKKEYYIKVARNNIKLLLLNDMPLDVYKSIFLEKQEDKNGQAENAE